MKRQNLPKEDLMEIDEEKEDIFGREKKVEDKLKNQKKRIIEY